MAFTPWANLLTDVVAGLPVKASTFRKFIENFIEQPPPVSIYSSELGDRVANPAFVNNSAWQPYQGVNLAARITEIVGSVPTTLKAVNVYALLRTGDAGLIGGGHSYSGLAMSNVNTQADRDKLRKLRSEARYDDSTQANLCLAEFTIPMAYSGGNPMLYYSTYLNTNVVGPNECFICITGVHY